MAKVKCAGQVQFLYLSRKIKRKIIAKCNLLADI